MIIIIINKIIKFLHFDGYVEIVNKAIKYKYKKNKIKIFFNYFINNMIQIMLVLFYQKDKTKYFNDWPKLLR